MAELSIKEIEETLLEMGEKAKIASYKLMAMNTDTKNDFLLEMAKVIEDSMDEIILENKKDLANGVANGLSEAMLDRLTLDKERIQAIADSVRDVIALEDPVAKNISTNIRPNGLQINKVSVPIGVIGIIYESRPNVTVDAAVLCLKAGNPVILRGGSEAINSNLILAKCLKRAGRNKGMPIGSVQLIPWSDRNAVSFMLKMDKYIDLIIPRGGEGLIRTVIEQSTIPVIKHYKGVCHLYVDSEADLNMAVEIAKNAKCQRPGVCNAIETLIIHKDIAKSAAPIIGETLAEEGVLLKGDSEFCKLFSDAIQTDENDWSEEYLNLTISIKIVDSIEEAIAHINQYGSGHSDAIVTNNAKRAELFLTTVDSSTVYHNASTRFTDGAEFGMGAEIGISTDKLHARGPMGLPELTTYKYVVNGTGQIR